MRHINNFEKNRKALKEWMVKHNIYCFPLTNPVKTEVYYYGNRENDSKPDIAYCQYVALLPRIYKGKIYRWELSFKDTKGECICYNDLSDGNFYKDVLNDLKDTREKWRKEWS